MTSAVYREVIMNEWTCQKQFINIYAEHSTLNDALQSSKPLQIDSNQIKILLDNNQHYITWVTTYVKKKNSNQDSPVR